MPSTDINQPDVETLRARDEVLTLAIPLLPKVETFNKNRWPNTYARDHLRSRWYYDPGLSEAGDVIRGLADRAGLPRDHVFELFATAYCQEHNIRIPVREVK